jgi:hypothetical protein
MTDPVTGTKRTFRALVVAASVIVSLAAACSDFTGVPASLPTLTDSGTVFALNGAPSGAPTALHLYTGTLLAADASFTFDLAFDIDAFGNPVILPQRTVATGLVPAHSVGMQHIDQEFSVLDKAPKSGYHPDTALVTRVGKTVAIQSQDRNLCGISITGTSIYAKLVVLSVDPAARKLSIQFTVDPNCGFISFLPGVPKD